MKRLSLVLIVQVLFFSNIFSQNIGIGTAFPHASAQLDITSTSKGVLIPRMVTASVGTILNPAKGLMIYDSLKNQLMVNMGNAVSPNWQTIVFNSGWSLSGNVGTDAASQFIGTIDNRTLYFRVNNGYAGRLDSLGTVSFGRGALFNTPSSKINVAIGDSALFKNGLNSVQSTYGTFNTATGPRSLFNNTDGSENTASGYKSLYSNTSGWLNTAIGTYAGQNSNSAWAVYIGESAGYNNMGYGNVIIGSKAGYLNTYGDGNTFLGNNAGGSNVSGNSNTFVGNFAGFTNTTGNNTFVGNYSGSSTNSGPANTATGSNSMYNNTTGYSNTANGNSALRSNSIGFSNTAIGAEALYSNTFAAHNTATGYQALRVSTGEKNTASGSLALTANTQGAYNTAEGYAAMYLNTSGINNTASGYGALYSNTSGHYNLAMGSLALYATTTSQYNTALGNTAGNLYNHGWNNDFVGANTNTNGHNYYNVIAIGQGTIVTGVSMARFGNASTTSYGGWAGWSNFSDGRFKTNIHENVVGLDFIMKLRPVTYNLMATALQISLMPKGDTMNQYMKIAMAEKEKILYTGFVAQEVETAAKQLGFDFSGVDKPKNNNDTYGLRYAEFVVPLVKAMQEQQQLIQQQQKQLDLLINEMQLLKDEIKKMK